MTFIGQPLNNFILQSTFRKNTNKFLKGRAHQGNENGKSLRKDTVPGMTICNNNVWILHGVTWGPEPLDVGEDDAL